MRNRENIFKSVSAYKLFLNIIVLQLSICSIVYAGPDPLVRIMDKRAATITGLKNEFVSKVLSSYNIPHQRNKQGVIIKIMVGQDWDSVETIEIVPEVTQDQAGLQKITHNIYFHSQSGILHLASDIQIKR